MCVCVPVCVCLCGCVWRVVVVARDGVCYVCVVCVAFVAVCVDVCVWLRV